MHVSIKRLYIFVLCTVTIGRIAAQSADTLIFQSQSIRSVGCGFPTVNYSLLSPLNHSGYSLNFLSTRFREIPKHLTQFHLQMKLGVLYNFANDQYITTLGFNSGWSRHWHSTDRARPLRLMSGVGIDAGISVYMKDDNTNNSMAFFFNLSTSPSILAKYRFNINNTKFELGQQIDVPFFSLISSSDYSASLPIGFAEEEASFFEAMRLVSFGSLMKCVTVTTLDISLPSRLPKFRISYIFKGMNYSHGDFTVKSADNIILFGAIFYLFR